MHELDLPLSDRAELGLEKLDDAELLTLSRAGNDAAYAALFTRYSYAAHRLARHLGQREEAEDVVADAFAQILDLLQRGKGPDRAFRAYLFTTIRHESGRRAKAAKKVMPTDDESQIDSAVPFGDGQLDEFEKSTIRAAYESLPDRWRSALWHLDVEGRKPHELADLIGMSPNGVSALVYRARAGLREAYLQQHVTAEEPSTAACSATRSKISAVVRRTASTREQERVHAHLSTCQDCMAVYLDLEDVNRQVGSIHLPTALAVSLAGAGVGLVVATGVGAALFQGLFVAKSALATVAMPLAATAATAVTAVGVASYLTEEPAAADVESVVAPEHEPAVGPSRTAATRQPAGVDTADDPTRAATAPTTLAPDPTPAVASKTPTAPAADKPESPLPVSAKVDSSGVRVTTPVADVEVPAPLAVVDEVLAPVTQLPPVAAVVEPVKETAGALGVDVDLLGTASAE